MSRNANRRLSDILNRLLRLFDILNTKHEHVSVKLVKEYYHSKRKFTYSLKEISDEFFIYRKVQVGQGDYRRAPIISI